MAFWPPLPATRYAENDKQPASPGQTLLGPSSKCCKSLWSSDHCSLASSPYRLVTKACTELNTAASLSHSIPLCPQTQRNDSSPSETPGFGPSALLGLGHHVRQRSRTWEPGGAGRLLHQPDPTDPDPTAVTVSACRRTPHAHTHAMQKAFQFSSPSCRITKMLRVERERPSDLIETIKEKKTG